jgi:SSS family solute:Na+ symporter
MLLGMLLPFRRSGPAAAIACWMAGAATFGALKLFPNVHWLGLEPRFENALTVGAPMLVSLLTYVVVGLAAPSRQPASQAFLMALHTERPSPPNTSDSNTNVIFEKA